MGVPNFLNENSLRTFPFLAHFQETVPVAVLGAMTLDMPLLPNTAIVDFGVTLGALSFYDDNEHVVYLASIVRNATDFIFTFKSTAPGLSGLELTFTRAVDSDTYITEYSTTADGPASVSLTGCSAEYPWFGYLVTGDLQELRDLLPADGWSLVGGPAEAVVEPALVRSMVNQFARSINLGNADRTRATTATECIDYSWSFDQEPIYVNRLCLAGAIRFKPGYNCLIRQNNVTNSLEFNANVGSGEGEPCEEVPLFEGEAPPTDGNLLTGGPSCDEVVRSINGVGGPVMNFIAGAGVALTPDPNNNRILADIDMNNLALCYSQTEPDDSACASLTANPNCGPAV